MVKEFTTPPEMIRRMSPDIRDQLMAQSAAARCYIDRAMGPHRQKETELVAFMAIFHPDWSEDKVRKLTRQLR